MTSSQSNTLLREKLGEQYTTLRQELAKKIVGLDRVVDHCLIAILAGGHCLLVGVPGVGKTLVVQSLAEVLSLQFSRIQFTPDLMPSDILGTQVIRASQETGKKELRFLRGPIFTNLFLADELNRTPPKTQAALMEAMEERQVSVSGEKQPLPQPFFTMATQNFVEQEGIYPLPFAQMDRFMFQLSLEYPTLEEELQIVEYTTSAYQATLPPILHREEILQYMEMVKPVPISESLVQYAIRLARASRPQNPEAPSFVKERVEWGASPRGPYYMILGAKAFALLQGKEEVELEDLLFVAQATLEHRIIRNYHAQVAKISANSLIQRLLDAVAPPKPRSWRSFFQIFFPNLARK